MRVSQGCQMACEALQSAAYCSTTEEISTIASENKLWKTSKAVRTQSSRLACVKLSINGYKPYQATYKHNVFIARLSELNQGRFW